MSEALNIVISIIILISALYILLTLVKQIKYNLIGLLIAVNSLPLALSQIKGLDIGLFLILIFTPILLLIALVLFLKRKNAKKILIAAGICLLIGAGLCGLKT